MNTADLSLPQPQQSPWPARLRVAAVVIIGLAYLHFVLGSSVFLRGLDRPLVFLGQLPLLTAVSSGLVLILLGGFASLTAPNGEKLRDGLLALGWILWLWSICGTTMDQWLCLKQPQPGAPTAAPYLALLPDYALLAVITGAVATMAYYRSSPPQPGMPIKPGPSSEFLHGAKAVLIAVFIALALLALASGPRLDLTRHGQNAFAAFVGCYVGVRIARHVTEVANPWWYVSIPFLVGLIGLLYAIARPGLPPPYEQINVIPCWGPARLLPAEMVGLGLMGSLWPLRPLTR